jgi:hypothetical protein
MLIWIRRIVFGLVKGVAALALGGAILWQVAEHCGSLKGVAYIHVSNSQVDVTVDDESYRIETLWDTPIVCELRPGRHALRMLQSGHVLFEQEFTLEPGQEVVLSAWDGFNRKRNDAPPSITSFDRSFSRSPLARRNP